MTVDGTVGYRRVGNRVQRVQALERLPDRRGRVVVVDRWNDGVGRALVDQLAGTGATVVLTARNSVKGAAVRDAVPRLHRQCGRPRRRPRPRGLASVRAWAPPSSSRGGSASTS